MTNTSKIAGALYGMAYGDAIGYPTEFAGYDYLRTRYGVRGPETPGQLRVSDDTQMSLAVWYALSQWNGEHYGMLRMEFMAAFLVWMRDPDNNRAPGTTCMSSLSRLERAGLGTWASYSTSPKSAGCGSVMRAPWIGLHPAVDAFNLRTVAAMQAVLTHGPAENAYTAIAAAELTRALSLGSVKPGGCAQFLVDLAHDLRDSDYDVKACSDLWRHVYRTDTVESVKIASPEDYVVEGAGHVGWVSGAAAQLAERMGRDGVWSFDPCEEAGEGWRADEALACAVGILDGMAKGVTDGWLDGEDLLRRAALTNGDSDSIGAILGALAGAAYGVEFWEAHGWTLEPRYAREISEIVSRF